MVEFEWDEKKNVSNFNKHKIWFEDAETVFYDPFEKTEEDYSDTNEERFQITGRTKSGRPVKVIFTIRHEETIRIISARPPTSQEWREYEHRPRQKK